MAALGCAWLSSLSWRGWRTSRLAVAVVCAVLLNLFVPEALYRAFNAARPASPKEPHGAFFYNHARRTDLHSRYGALCAKAIPADPGEAPSDGSLRPGSLVVTGTPGWEVYGHVAYGLAATGRARRLSQASPAPGVFLHRYALGGMEMRILHISESEAAGSNPGLTDLLAAARAEGFILFVPAEIAALLSREDSALSFTRY